MAGSLSAVCSLDWETCRILIEKHIPGGVAQAMVGGVGDTSHYGTSAINGNTYTYEWESVPNNAGMDACPFYWVVTAAHTRPL